MADDEVSGRLTAVQGAALTVGAVLGTGVISLPALAAQVAGPASLVAWVLMVLVSVPLAATFAALGTRSPDAGGVSTYVRAAFGGRAAAVVGWSFYLAVPLAAPPAAAFAGGYVAGVWGGGRTTTLVTAGAIIVVVAVGNAFGLRVSGRASLVMSGTLAAVLLVTTLVALPHASLAHLRPFAPHGWTAVGPAAALVVWGFAGWEAVTSLSGEYRRPARDIPRATAAAVVVVGVLYLGVVAASLAVLGPAASTSPAPLADLLAVALGPSARVVMTVIALLLTLGAMNAYLAGASRLGAALGRDGALPSWLARGSATGEVPRRSLLVVTVLAMASLAATALGWLDLHTSVLLVTGQFSLVYVLSTAAAVRLLPRRSRAHVAACVSVVATSGLLLLTGPRVVWALGVALVALGYASWAGSRARRARPAADAAPPPGLAACELGGGATP
ncbi:APC family permease [Angustibacter peucedani]